MEDFLNYLAGKSPRNDLTRKIETALELARSKEEWRCEYMTLLMRDQENIQKGKIEGKVELLVKLVSDGTISIQKAAAEADLDVESFEKLLKEND